MSAYGVPAYPLLAALPGGRVQHAARLIGTGPTVTTLCRKRGVPVDDGASLPYCRACAARPNPILWSIGDVAAFLGAASPASARRTIGRWGVTAVAYAPRASGGGVEARYDPAQVRQAAATRPGRGARTDLHP